MMIVYQELLIIVLRYIKYNFDDIKKNPDWFIMKKLGRFRRIRELRKKIYARSHPLPNPDKKNISSTVFKNIDIDTVTHQLTQKGIYIGLNLPPEITQAIKDFADNHRCYSCTGMFNSLQPQLGFYPHEYPQAQLKLQRTSLIAEYFNFSSICPAIQQLENDPVLKAIASQYLGVPVVHVGTKMWWSFPPHPDLPPAKPVRQLFHIDLDDYNFVKFFFYLTDVDLQNGPHVYIRGSHKNQTFWHQLLKGRSTDSRIVKYYGKDSLLVVCGPAGQGFVIEPTGFHQGSSVISSPRLLLNIIFATVDYDMFYTNVDPQKLTCIL